MPAPPPVARLSGIRGHARVRTMFARLLADDRLAPVYLFCGPTGVGKATFAVALARALLCRTAPGVGCADCPSCHKILAGTHPDLRVLAPEPGGVFGIDLARQLRKEIGVVPWESDLRVFVLDDVDRLNPEAGNALLKTLEEPPAHARLILVAQHTADLLETIESRCQAVRFGPLAEADIAAELVARGQTPNEARAVAAMAGGSLGQALSTGDRLTALRERLLALWADGPRPAAAGALVELLEGIEVAARRALVRQGLDLITMVHRDRLAEQLGAASRLQPELDPGLLARLPADPERLLDRIDALADAREAVDSNVDPRLILEDVSRFLVPAGRAR